jgi:hypothetical protein
LLQCGGVNHDIRFFHRSLQPTDIANVSDEISKVRMVESIRPHLMLLRFIPREYHQFFGVMVSKHDFCEFSAERTGASGN